MRIAEIDRNTLREEYKGDWKQYINTENALCVWDNERARHAFSFGNGTTHDLNRYMKDNRCFCKFYDLENSCWIYQ